MIFENQNEWSSVVVENTKCVIHRYIQFSEAVSSINWILKNRKSEHNYTQAKKLFLLMKCKSCSIGYLKNSIAKKLYFHRHLFFSRTVLSFLKIFAANFVPCTIRRNVNTIVALKLLHDQNSIAKLFSHYSYLNFSKPLNSKNFTDEPVRIKISLSITVWYFSLLSYKAIFPRQDSCNFHIPTAKKN